MENLCYLLDGKFAYNELAGVHLHFLERYLNSALLAACQGLRGLADSFISLCRLYTSLSD
jgi:hypothetical protein